MPVPRSVTSDSLSHFCPLACAIGERQQLDSDLMTGVALLLVQTVLTLLRRSSESSSSSAALLHEASSLWVSCLPAGYGLQEILHVFLGPWLIALARLMHLRLLLRKVIV